MPEPRPGARLLWFHTCTSVISTLEVWAQASQENHPKQEEARIAALGFVWVHVSLYTRKKYTET